MCARVYFPRVDVWATREGSARGRCRGGWFSTGRELSFCRNKTRLSNQARAKLMGQQPLSPLWNARIYQRAEVALRAKDFPIVTGFSGAFSSTSAIFHSPCSRAHRSISLIALKCTSRPRFSARPVRYVVRARNSRVRFEASFYHVAISRSSFRDAGCVYAFEIQPAS